METNFPRAGVGMATKVPGRGSCYGNLWPSTCFVMAFSRVAVFGDVIYKLKYQFK